MKEAGRAVVRFVFRLLPKADIAVIWGWPDHEDNVVALERALQATRLRRVYVLMTDRRSPPVQPVGPKTRCIAKDGPAGWLAFLFARYVFFTHRCFMRHFPPNVVSVNVWHGMPIKRIEALAEEGGGIRSTYVLATSPFWGEIMQRSMGPGPEPLVTGLPRNDRLFLDRSAAWDALGLTERSDVDHLVAWLPTYRRSVTGLITVDGRPTDSPFELDDVDPAALNDFLAAHRAYAVVKPHPMAAFSGEQQWSHLLLLDSAHLLARSLTLYQLLAATDVLISDVSSVTIDFLLLDRPIIHALADLEEYRDSRGFSVERIDDLLMGAVATTVAELQHQLAGILGGADPDAERRRRVRDRSHLHRDDGATARLIEAVGLG
jgi:CDP-glycerol glycerophosphotransferase (TagB/SpsB family)